MITVADIIQLHEMSIERYGGSTGIRDKGLLSSAVARPYQTLDGQFLYPTVIEKAAAMMESLIINHPFVDGNKRTGYLAVFALLTLEKFQLTASETEAYDFTIAVSTGNAKYDDIVSFLHKHTKPV